VQHITTPAGIRVSFDRRGSGPPLVVVHGAFSDHDSNWEFVRPLWETRFTVHAVARRGRGGTDATQGHGLEDEGRDLAAVIRSIGEPVFLLGHSYGAHTALLAAAEDPSRVRKLVLYEPAWPHVVSSDAMRPLEELARAGDWDEFCVTFFRDLLRVPAAEVDAVRASDGLWSPIRRDAEASLGDLRAIARYEFRPERFRELHVPVLLQVGTESPRDLYVTDALAAVLPDARIGRLDGQAHEGMTTAPEMYADAVMRFLL
jgi:pimeloyl-ACP methyl ester carboxylesterase